MTDESNIQLKELPVTKDTERIVRESAYVEPEFSDWLQEYAVKLGASRSNAMRRLMILGAQSEGYVFDGTTMADLTGIGGSKNV